MSQTVVQLEGVTKRYGDSSPAVDHLDLAVQTGEFIALLGPSGCGKTTTLRMIAGFITPTGGRITIAGQDATSLPPEKRNLGMVFQSYALFPHMSVFDNVAYGLRTRKVPEAEIKRRVQEALTLVDLQHLADRLPKQLSGGQQQRVALARAVVIRPTVLLLDEPLSNLDARLRIQMRQELKRIQQETGLTAILVTHDQEEALSTADRIAILNQGRLQQAGAPKDVFHQPNSRFVADFLGFENFLPGAALDLGNSLCTIRPEYVQVLAPGQNASGEGRVLAGIVRTATYQGTRTSLLLETPAGSLTAVAEGDRWQTGDAVAAFLPASRLIQLPAEA
jgi:putative spermidine/putrescine transport system ATP-binding protein